VAESNELKAKIVAIKTRIAIGYMLVNMLAGDADERAPRAAEILTGQIGQLEIELATVSEELAPSQTGFVPHDIVIGMNPAELNIDTSLG
jgi:hypothetical protein